MTIFVTMYHLLPPLFIHHYRVEQYPGLCAGVWQWFVACVGFEAIELLHDPLADEMEKEKEKEVTRQTHPIHFIFG